MFQKQTPQYTVNSVANISLEATGPYSFVYTPDGKKLEIDSEPLKQENGTYKVLIYTSTIEEWDHDDTAEISNNERQHILDNIKEALHSLDMEVEFADE